MKYEWRKREKEFYLPKATPTIVDIPEFQFLTVKGAGNPNTDHFTKHITVLYSMAYAIKMNLKKVQNPPAGYRDYTVYPLEGIWDINEKARKTFQGKINKDDLVFTLMLRQPDFITVDFFAEMKKLVEQKKPHDLLEFVKFEKITDGKSVQMMHIGPFDDEPASFARMEAFAAEQNLTRKSKVHREIYISDFRKVAPERLKTVLRFEVI